MGHILIAGGAGFIGSNLVDHFLRTTSDKVTVYDNYSTGSPSNLQNHVENPRLSIVNCDINTLKIANTMDFDVIYHLASRASPIDFVKYSVEILRTNSMGTQNLLDLALRSGAKFVLASTSEVYGEAIIHPQPETYYGNVNSLGERAPYNEGKRYAEAITMAYHRKFGLRTTIFRIFNTYGPNMRANDGRVIPNFVNQALAGALLTIKGTGDQTRSFCFVNDLVRGLADIITKSNVSGDVFNIGNDYEISIIDLAMIVCDILNRQLDVKYLPAMKDEPKRRRPDLSKIKSRLGWKSSTNLKEGLIKTINYFSADKISTGFIDREVMRVAGK